MEEQYKIVFTGELKPNIEKTAFIKVFCERFGVHEEKALALTNADGEVVIKKGLDFDHAIKFRRVMDKIGMVVRLDSMLRETAPLEPDNDKTQILNYEQIGESSAQNQSDKICPKCGSERIKDDNCLGCGIVISKYMAKLAEQENS